jgi:cytochrome c biogenesis protein CcmG, thiol:disulfide interchange protein DsbE
MTRRSAPVLLACALLVTLAACGGDGQTAAPSVSLLPRSATELPTMDPTTFAALVAQQRGTPVLVNFWGSWCPPCREETPDLIAAHRRWGDTVRFIGVDLADNRDGATSFIDEFGVPYPSVFDPSNAIAVSYGLFSPPATLFFDANGTLVKTIPGQISAQDLETNIESIAS